MKLSVTIITFNEERNLDRLLKSVDFADEIIVVDSQSQDQTVKIAESYGAKVIQNSFAGYGQQKNFAEESAQGEWILSIDADEEISPELKHSILTAISADSPLNVYALNRKTKFVSRWIEHGGWYPDWIPRLYKKGTAKWSTPPVHEQLTPENRHDSIGKLSGILNHYSFPSVVSQIDTNLKYAQLGASALVLKKNRKPTIAELLFRPLFKFFECYFIKRGFLDGVEGFIIAINAAHSMFIKYSVAYLEDDQGD